MLRLKLKLVIVFITASLQSFAQQEFPKDYFRHPMNREVLLAGNFSEIRPNHFHSGVDMKTGAKVGENVYAAADGYVSRINISAWGGGKILYITHPNGYKTVYMHLDEFCGEIGRFVHDYQYSRHTFAFDIDLPKDSIKVRKGQLVALSGNTGGSGGPHLHFEVRYAENDQAINPLYFGIQYNDPITPTIAGIKLYPANSRSTINGKNEELKVYPTTSAKGKGRQQQTSSEIVVTGRFYTGIYAYDQMEAGSNKNGVEKIEVYVDGELLHRFHVPSLLFEETRGINAIIDYPQYQRNREYYIVSRHLRGDLNNFSTAFRDNGYIEFTDHETHQLEFIVSDYKGNTTRKSITVRSNPDAMLGEEYDSLHGIQPSGEPIIYYRPFSMSDEGFRMSMKAHTIYENDELTYSRSRDAAGVTPQHNISLRRHPLPPHIPFDVYIDIPKNIPEHLLDKLTIVCTNGKKASALKTTIEGDILRASTRSFGGFSVRLDTVAPTVRPVNFKDGGRLTSPTLSVKVSDNLSGVESYECTINGNWELAEHDGKTATLNVSSALLHKGSNKITFRIKDAAGNETSATYTLTK